ncbi:MAG: LuxR C-terminal-related transcriptional regulator [Gemmatimonadaceae bacterium]
MDKLDAIERRAVSAYLSGEEEASEELWTAAHNECLRSSDPIRAARCTFWIVLDLFNRGEWARGNGWLARGMHLLEPGTDSPELGLLSVLATRQNLKQGDIDSAAQAAGRAMALSRQFNDPELHVFSRLGLALVHARRGEFTEAACLFDEIMVAVTVDEVSPVAVGVVYCAVIDACHSLLDLGRAREWTAALDRWCSAQPDLVAFRGKCLVHRSEIMRFSGDWSDALAEARQACAWSEARPSSFRYPTGAAYYELAEIHRLRGDFDAAEAAYRRASEHGQVPEPGLTLLQFAQNKPAVAAAGIRRLLNEQRGGVMRAAVLHAAAEILVSVDDLAAARAAADELARLTEHYYAPAMRALAAYAAGVVTLAERDAHAALASLRLSWMLWQELDAPYDAARARVVLGLACRQIGDEAAADLEFESARRVFDRLAARPDIARVEALRQQNHRSRKSTLTPRELEVIELLAKGKTNRAISRQLAISERTVDRHVSNILLKLELPSRSAATAYAYQHDLI